MDDKLSSRMITHKSYFRSRNVVGGIRLSRRLISSNGRLCGRRCRLALLKGGVQFLSRESCFGGFAASMCPFHLVQFSLNFFFSFFRDACRKGRGDPFGSLNHQPKDNAQARQNDQAEDLPKAEPAGFWRRRVDVHGAYCAMSQKPF